MEALLINRVDVLLHLAIDPCISRHLSYWITLEVVMQQVRVTKYDKNNEDCVRKNIYIRTTDPSSLRIRQELIRGY